MTKHDDVLVVAAHDNLSILPSTLNAVTAALHCGGDVHVLVIGHAAGSAAHAAATIAGIAKVWVAGGVHFAAALAEDCAAQVMAIAPAYGFIVFPAGAAGECVAARVAALLDVALVARVVRVLAPDIFVRSIQHGSAHATVQSIDAIKVLALADGCFAAAPAEGGAALVETLAAVPDAGLSSLTRPARGVAWTVDPAVGA